MIVTVSSFLMETGAVLFALSCLTLLSCRFFRFGIINMLAADACFGLAMVFPRRVIEFLGADSPVLSFIERGQIRATFVAMALYALISAALYVLCYSWRHPRRRRAAAAAGAAAGLHPESAPSAAAAPASDEAPAAVPAAEELPVSGWTAGSADGPAAPEVPDVLRGLRAVDAPDASDGAQEAERAAGELADKG